MNAPDFSPHLLPRPEVSQPAASPKPAASTSLGKGQVDRDRPRVDRDGPYKGKNSKGGKGKGKTKGGSVSMPLPLRGMNAKTKDGKPKCFDFNLQHGCQHKDTDCPKGHHSCMNGVVAMPSTRFRPATPSLRNPGGLDYPPRMNQQLQHRCMPTPSQRSLVPIQISHFRIHQPLQYQYLSMLLYHVFEESL